MKIPHKKKDYFLPLMFVCACILCAVCFMSHSSGTSTFLSKGLSVVTTPLRSTTSSIYRSVSSVFEYFSDVKALNEENEKLKTENAKLKKENEGFLSIQKENENLYKFLDLKKEHTDYKLTNANIISKSSQGFISIFTIDKGSFHGIEENMPIITPTGALMGVTYSVETNSTRCISILSYDTKVGIYDENTGETGILSGSFETFNQNKCIIESIPPDSSIKEGDTILTSGLGNIYPRGVTIGKVCGFINDLGTHTKSAVVSVDESVFDSDSIMVITDFSRNYK